MRLAGGDHESPGVTRQTSISGSILGQAILLICTLGVIWGVIAVQLRREYHRAAFDAETRTANLARAFEETVSRSIAVLDQALEHVRDSYLRDPGHFTLTDWLRDKQVLKQISVQLGIAGEDGLTESTATPGGPKVDISDREHFKVHIAAVEDRLFISKPVLGRASGRLSIQFTRRVTGKDGGFAGVVVASLDPNVLGLFRESSRMGEGFALLAGRDGIVRASRPDTAMIGRAASLPLSIDLARLFDGGGGGDGTETLWTPEAIVSYRSVTGYPLFVEVGISRGTAFASYEEAYRQAMLAGICLSLIVLLVGTIMLRHRQRLTRFHRALSLTMDNVSQGILMIDARRRMPVVNRRVAELLDLPPDLVEPGAAFDTLLRWQNTHGEFAAEAPDDNRIMTMVNSGGIDASLGFYERTRANGTVLEIRTTVLPDGSAVRTYTDVTERKRIERELADARDAAEAGARARTEFLAIMSHEIRTPINGIVGAATLMRDMRLDVEQREYLRIICDSSDHLLALIQDILDLSRLDAGRLELEEIAFDVRTLIEGTIGMLNGEAHASGLYLTARIAEDVPAAVSGDPSRLRQVLVNLIGNGIKFTPAGGVTVEAQTIASDKQTVLLSIAVIDSGIGIEPEKKDKLFSAFTQADSTIARRYGGSGLGLAICGHLVGLMGGTIQADSLPGHGSTFRFTVRLRHASPVAAPEASATSGASAPSGLKLLLAEDNPTNRHVAIRMLTRMGHTVDAVEDGAKAIAAAAAADYDAILMDMMMPEVDGLTATRAIRASAPPKCFVPIIGVTANAMATDRAACEAAGMNGFVTKPITMDRLRAALEQTPRRRSGPDSGPCGPDKEPLLDATFLDQLGAEIGVDGAAEVMRIFLEEAPTHMAAIQSAMRGGAIQAVRREAHALAGAARNVGLKRVGEAAYALQQATERSGPDPGSVDALAGLLQETMPLAAHWASTRDALTASPSG